MSSAQFFRALCLPIVVFIIGLYHQNTGIRDLRAELIQFRSEVNTRFLSVDAKFDTLTGKVVDIDNRMVRVEERLKL